MNEVRMLALTKPG